MKQGELVGLSETAGVLAVTKRTATRYSQRDDFPVPVDRLAAGPVWRRDDVVAWGRDHLPLPAGRPKKVTDATPSGGGDGRRG